MKKKITIKPILCVHSFTTKLSIKDRVLIQILTSIYPLSALFNFDSLNNLFMYLFTLTMKNTTKQLFNLISSEIVFCMKNFRNITSYS